MYDFRDCVSDEEKFFLINDILNYFADKYPNNRTMRRRFHRTMESLADLMVQEGYLAKNPYDMD